MRIIKSWEWTKEDRVSLAVFAAELVLPNFEKEFFNNKRPRQAIEAAKRWLKEKSETARSTADSAANAVWGISLTNMPGTACAAARAAANAANTASRTVGSGSAWSAMDSAAESVAWNRSILSYVVRKRFLNKCEKFVLKRLSKKRRMK